MKGTIDLGLLFKKIWGKNNQHLVGFIDSNFVSNLDNRRSQTGFMFTLLGTAINWKSNLQHVVALLTTKVKYLAITEPVKEGI